MKEKQSKIALGGGCHWCTEAVFQSLKGVLKVEQGFVASYGENSSFSEAVIVHFDPLLIQLKNLIEIHLHTHQSSSNHSMRAKYRSAVYTFSEEQHQNTIRILDQLQPTFNNELVTQVLSFSEFKPSRDHIQNYYLKDPNKPFCKTFIDPKLKWLLKTFSGRVKKDQLLHLKTSQ